MGFLSALIPLFAGFTQPIKDYFAYKAKESEAKNALALATIQAQAEQAKAQASAETAQQQAKLGATSNEFKQWSFCLLVLPLLFSVFFPSKAAVMWHNFEAIPEWFRTLFGAVYLTIWGIPVASNYLSGIFSGLSGAIDARREYKLEKARINKAAVFAELKAKLFTKGMTQKQVDVVDKALDKGEN